MKMFVVTEQVRIFGYDYFGDLFASLVHSDDQNCEA